MSEVEILDGADAERLVGHRNFDEPQTILALGKRKQGKTFFMNSYIQVCEPRVLAIVLHDEFTGLQQSASIEDALDDMWANPIACRRRVRPPFGARTRDWANEVFGELLSSLRNSLILLDEIAKWSKPKQSEELEDLILQGRHYGLRMMIGSQILKLVPYDLQSEATDLVIFKTSRSADLDALAEMTDRNIAEKAKRLTRGQCLHVEL